MADPSTATAKKKKRGCRGCLKWLLIIFGVLLLIGAILAALFYRVPDRLGIIPSAAEKRLTGVPDREASASMLAEAQAAGMNAQGVSLYVLPMKEGDESIAFALLNSTEGFAFPRGGQRDPMIQTLIQLGTTATARQAGVSVVGFEFLDDQGRSYMTIAARTEDIQAVANGRMTDHQFMQVSYGDIRMDEVFSAEMEALQELLSNSEAQ